MDSNVTSHWNEVYNSKPPDTVSWFQLRPELSLRLIADYAPDKNSWIIDVGGGASTLVDALIEVRYRNLAVVDIAKTALGLSKARLGSAGNDVDWIVTDITTLDLAPASIDLWHDRAVFHFLTIAADRDAYVARLASSVISGGHTVIATFALDGPERCSGLDTVRYDEASLAAEIGTAFELVKTEYETHRTPFGTDQKFIYCVFRRS